MPDLGALLLFGIMAVAAFGFAVWFGQRVLAPPIERALDRPEPEDADIDRHD